MIYVIDTDSLIALRRIYSPECFSDLWEQLGNLIQSQKLISTTINFTELKISEDDAIFTEWKNTHSEMFIEIDEDIQKVVMEILDRFPDLIDPDLDQEQADPYLIALAKSRNATVIIEEKPLDSKAVNDPNRKAKMKIPNVCSHYDIKVMDITAFANSKEWREDAR